MGSFLTALTSVGAQYGEAKDEARQEKAKLGAEERRLTAEEAYAQLARQRESREAKAQEDAKARGDILVIQGRPWSVSKQKFIETGAPDPMNTLREFIKTLPPDQQRGAASRAQVTLESEPNNPKAAVDAVLAYANTQQAETARREDAATREKERREDKAAADKVREQERLENRQASQDFQRQMRSDQHDFEKMMVDLRLQERQKYMTPQERQVYDTIKQVEPSVDRTIAFLEGTKNSDGKPLKEEDAYVFGDRSALMQHLRFRGYKFGTKQEDISQQLIKNAALIQVLGARPWMTMGRGKYIYEVVSAHLPKPTDTPALLYDKLTWLRDNVLADAKDSLSGYVQPGGARQTGAPGAGDDPLQLLTPGAPQ